MPHRTLFLNGHITTMDPRTPVADALLAVDGVVEATGSEADLRRRAPDAAVIDLGGRFALPGFVDAHNHFSLNALAPLEVDCRTPPNGSMRELLERVQTAAAALPPGRWLRGHGYDDVLLGGHPTRADLDAVAPHNPVVLVHSSVHRCVVNSAALRAVSVDGADGDPARGWVPLDADGAATGLLYEYATNPFQAASLREYARVHEAALPDLVGRAEADLLAQGITAAGDVYVHPWLFAMYAPAMTRIAVRPFVGSPFGLFAEPWDGVQDAVAPGYRWTHAPGVKIFADGGGNTTATSMASGVSPRFRFYAQSRLDALVAWAHGGSGVSMPIAIHAAGDIAVTMALDAFEAAIRAHPDTEPRFRIEHAITIKEADIPRLARLGVILVTQPAIVFHSGARLAAAKLAVGVRVAPFRAMIEAGVTVAFSSDSPCYSLSPLWQMWCAVTRSLEGGGTLDDGQAVTTEQALHAYTVAGAQAIFAPQVHGSLAPGGRADITVLSANPRATPLNRWSDIRVERVFVAAAEVPLPPADAAPPGRPLPHWTSPPGRNPGQIQHSQGHSIGGCGAHLPPDPLPAQERGSGGRFDITG